MYWAKMLILSMKEVSIDTNGPKKTCSFNVFINYFRENYHLINNDIFS